MRKMNLLARLITFLLTFTLALAIVNLFVRPLLRAVNVPPITISMPTPPDMPAVSSQPLNSVSYKTQFVSLDFLRGKAYATLTLKRLPQYPVPEKICIQLHFFAPDRASRKSWSSGPVEVREPFAMSETKTITVESSCNWCDDADVPANGYYARISLSDAPANDAAVSEDEMDFHITNATPVLVQNKRGAFTSH